MGTAKVISQQYFPLIKEKIKERYISLPTLNINR